jgi:zinc protease
MMRRPSTLAGFTLAICLATACAHGRSTPAPTSAPAVASAPAAQAAPQPPPAPAGPDRSKVPENGAPPALRLPDQKHFALENGLRVRLVEDHQLPIVALNLVVNAGAAHDPATRPGLASMVADMMTEGTRTRTATQISDEVGFIGGSLDAAAGFDAAALSGNSLSRHLPKLLEVFADVAMNPTFPRRDFERVQNERLVALLQQRDQPAAVAGKAFARAFWGSHPYGHWAQGTEDSVKAMTPAELARYHAAYWNPANAELVVVGDATEADLRPLLEKTLGAWKPGKVARIAQPPQPAVMRKTVILSKAGAPQAYLILGMPGIPRSSPDYYAAQVAFQVLGGGSASRLFRELREAKGYTYGIYARAEARKLGGSSLVVGSVKSEQTGAAMKDLLAEIGRIRTEPVPSEELTEAKDAIVLGLPADFATVSGIAGRLAELVIHGLPDDYWNGFVQRIRAVTAEDVTRVSRQLLDPSRLTAVMVGEPAVIQPQLEDLPVGTIEVRPAPGRPEVVPPPPKMLKPGRPAASKLGVEAR